MAHSHMAGVDVVFYQLMPGYDNGYFRSMHAPGWEMSFFSHVLGKVGGSLAHLDAMRKQGQCMAETFGAFGWGEGTRLEKWVLDYLLSRGVNFFVPHAFTCKDFPDSDCPPHFWADGHDPQWREFGLLMRYAQRVLGLVSGGRYDAPVRASEATDVSGILNTLATAAEAVPIERFASACAKLGLRELIPSTEQPWLRSYHYVKDDVDEWLFLNEMLRAG